MITETPAMNIQEITIRDLVNELYNQRGQMVEVRWVLSGGQGFRVMDARTHELQQTCPSYEELITYLKARITGPSNLHLILASRDNSDVLDDTVGDCIDPAYFRGVDYGVRSTVIFVEKILDGKDTGKGVVGDPELEALRRRLLDMVQILNDIPGVDSRSQAAEYHREGDLIR